MKYNIKVCKECGSDMYYDMCGKCGTVGEFEYIYRED